MERSSHHLLIKASPERWKLDIRMVMKGTL